jgi:LCP family protein required for cell wall assembly
VLERVAPGQLPQNILVLGADGPHQPEDPDAPRSDTVILVRVGLRSVHAVWFPRDLAVRIPGQGGTGRINQAFSIGGPQLAIETLKANFGVDVNHFVALDMRAMRELVDALGGVRIAFPEALRDSQSGLQVPAGCVRVDGATAVALTRSRATEAYRGGSWQLVDLRSDLDRVQRQQELVQVLAGAVRSDVDGHPLRMADLVNTVLNHVQVDDTFDRQGVLRLARALVGVGAGHFETSVLPVAEVPDDPSRLAVAIGSDVTLHQLGGSILPSTLGPVTPTAGGELRPC